MAVTPNAAPTGYNSAYTGPQIDAAVGAVIDKETAWDEAAAGKLPAGGEAGQVLEKTGAEDNAAEWRTPPFLTRPNLLDNWYFVGGGSQLGDGVFPINQRGQTVYEGAVYGIDRWRVTGGGTVTLPNDKRCVVFNSGNGDYNKRFIQGLGAPLNPGKYTLSVMLKINSITGSATLRLNEGSSVVPGGAKSIPTIVGEAQVVANTIEFSAVINNPTIEILIPPTGDVSIDIFAFKLELGSTQTLAHQENGVWVLNELPDFGEELKKCERHYFRKAFSRLPALFIGGTFDYIDVNIPIYDLAARATVSKTVLIVAPNVAYVEGEQKTISSCTVESIMRDGTDGQLCVRFKTNHLTDSAYAMGALDAFRIVIEA